MFPSRFTTLLLAGALSACGDSSGDAATDADTTLPADTLPGADAADTTPADTRTDTLAPPDASGDVGSCDPSSALPAPTSMSTADPGALDLELSWTYVPVPGGVPETWTDLDLHVALPTSSGGYDGNGDGIDDPWYADDAAWWQDQNHDWGVDRIDSGGGPIERAQLRVQPGQRYLVGVYFFGARTPRPETVTLKIRGGDHVTVLAERTAQLELHDFWWVGEIDGTDAALHPYGGCTQSAALCLEAEDCACPVCDYAPYVTPDYRHPREGEPAR